MQQPSIQPQITQPLESNYIPGSTEKKKCVMMYGFIGIVLSIAKGETTPFEEFHLKQSMGWRALFVALLLFATIVMFVPFVRIVGWLLIIIMLGIRGVFCKQARDGVYFTRMDASVLPVFVGMGGWILQLFDIQIHTGIDELPKQ